ncbi:MAG: hypothetical protein ACJAT1_001997, partial [Marivirga sp.]
FFNLHVHIVGVITNNRQALITRRGIILQIVK